MTKIINDQPNESTSNDKQTEQEKKAKQQQSDPQLTELKGFVDPDEKLEPEVEDEGEGSMKE